MTIDRRLIAGALGLALALAACGGSSTTSPAATTGATGAPTEAPAAATPVPTEAAATDEATEEPTDDGGAEPSLVAGAAADLEAMLPDEAGGIKYAKTSFNGASIGAAGMGIDTGELGPILEANGKTINDVRVAVAAPADTSGGETGMVIAIQIDGVPGDKVLGATGMDTAGLEKATVGGKQVVKAGAQGFSVIIYVKDDVLFEVLLASDAVAEDILSQLP